MVEKLREEINGLIVDAVDKCALGKEAPFEWIADSLSINHFEVLLRAAHTWEVAKRELEEERERKVN